MKKKFVVTVDIPDGITVSDIRQYIRVAIQTWRHSGDPTDNPLFDMPDKAFKVESLTNKTIEKLYIEREE